MADRTKFRLTVEGFTDDLDAVRLLDEAVTEFADTIVESGAFGTIIWDSQNQGANFTRELRAQTPPPEAAPEDEPVPVADESVTAQEPEVVPEAPEAEAPAPGADAPGEPVPGDDVASVELSQS